MKRYFNIVSLFFVMLFSYAEAFGQNVSGYAFTATTGPYKALTAYTSATLSGGDWDDGYYNGIPIGFTFTYGGTSYTTISQSTNGWLTFGQNISNSYYANALNGSGKRPLLAPLWDDIGVGCYGSDIRYATTGSSPNRVFTIEYVYALWNVNNSVCSIHFETKLYETTNVIEFIYQQTGAGNPTNASASIGITGSAATDFWSLNGTGASPTANYGTETSTLSTMPATNQIYRWTPSTCTPPTTQASVFSTNGITGSSMNIAFTRGNGTGGVLVVARAGSTPSPDPVSGTTYTANSIYGSGTACGGGFVVYNGTAAGVSTPTGNINISGLNPSTTYYYAVYEYNTTGKCYKTPALTGNAATAACGSTVFSQNFEGAAAPGWTPTDKVIGTTTNGSTTTIPIGTPANQVWAAYNGNGSNANDLWHRSNNSTGWGSTNNICGGALPPPACGANATAYSLIFDNYDAAVSSWGSVQTQVINLQGYTGTTLNFYYANDNSAAATLNVQFWNGASWVDVVGSPFTGNSTNSWSLKSVAVPASCLINGTALKFVATASSEASPRPICIDEITITGCPGTPSGNAYGIYAPAAQASATITDCEIYATGGTNGTGCNDCNPTSAAYGSANISNTTTFPIIIAGDVTNTNTNCTADNMNMTTAAASPDWTGSTAGLTGAGSPKTANYASTGRKNVKLQSGSATYTWTDGFEGATSWVLTAGNGFATIGVPDATNCSGAGSNCAAMTAGARTGTKVLSLRNCNNGSAPNTYGAIALTVAAGGGTFSGYYANSSEQGFDGLKYKIDAGAWTFVTGAPATCSSAGYTAFSFAVTAGAHTIYLGYYTDGATINYGSKVFVDDVQCTNISGVVTTATYTDFNNILTASPSAGTILSSLTGGCPGSYYFQSSLGTPAGYSFNWAISPAPPGCITYTIATPNASSTSINFASSCATNQTVTLTCTVTSPCCGVLATVPTFTFVVDAYPANPTGSAVGSPVCPGGCSTLSATAPAGANFEWYDAASNGNLLSAGANYVDCPAVTTTYYVEAISSAGCINTTLTPVVITVTSTTPPTANNVSSCSPGVSLSVNAPVSGATYNWYDACPPAGTLLGQGISFTCSTCSVVGTYTYYVTVTMPGCNASSCTPVTVTITGNPASVTWVGGTAGHLQDWFTASNWNPACLPTCGTDVTIPNVANHPDIGFNISPAACQGFTLASGATLSFSDNKSELDVCGNFFQSGIVTTNGKGKVVFMGSVAQTFTKFNGATGTMHNVDINNTGTPATLTIVDGVVGGITYQDLSIDSNLVFANGIIVTQGGRKVVVDNSKSSSVSGHGVNAYVNGRITRKVAAANNYDFPVGNSPVGATVNPYELMNINFASITGFSYLTVSFENPTNAPGSGLPLTEQAAQYTVPLVDNGGTNTGVGYAGSVGGVWTVFTGTTAASIYNASPTTASYDMTVYGTNFDNAAAGNFYSIIKRVPFCPAAWVLDGTPSVASNPGTLITAGRTGLSGFSQFAIAKHVTPLPVSLVAFDATCVAPNIVLSWITATEMNNNHFTIERSCDENYFQYQTIATIPGAGNSSTMKQYSFTDQDAPGDCYYRLSQTDNNGTTTLFAPISINCKENANFNFIGALPNPTLDQLNVLFSDAQNENIQLVITDMLGQSIMTKNITSEPGLNKITLDLTEYSAGMYMVKLNNDSKSFTKKIVKIK